MKKQMLASNSPTKYVTIKNKYPKRLTSRLHPTAAGNNEMHKFLLSTFTVFANYFNNNVAIYSTKKKKKLKLLLFPGELLLFLLLFIKILFPGDGTI